MEIKLLVEGGDMKPGPALSQKLGPTGINVNEVLKKVNEATKEFKGMKVPVTLEIDIQTKEIRPKVSSPSASELIKKQLGIEKGSGKQKTFLMGNASIEDIIFVAKAKFSNLLCKDLKSAVKTVIGSCVSLGILIENKLAKEIEAEVEKGKYDKEIKSESIKTPEEKRKLLKEFFSEIEKKQAEILKQEEAVKAAATAESAAPAAGTASTPAAKTEEKKK